MRRKRRKKKKKIVTSIMSHGSATPSHSLPVSVMSRNNSALRSLDLCPTQERQRNWLHFTSSMLHGC